jgi:hypothetical protein
MDENYLEPCEFLQWIKWQMGGNQTGKEGENEGMKSYPVCSYECISLLPALSSTSCLVLLGWPLSYLWPFPFSRGGNQGQKRCGFSQWQNWHWNLINLMGMRAFCLAKE